MTAPKTPIRTPDHVRALLIAALDARDHEAAAEHARTLHAYCDRAGILAKWLVVDDLFAALDGYCSHRVEVMHRELLPVLVSYASQAWERTSTDREPGARLRFEASARERFAHLLLSYTLDRAGVVDDARKAADVPPLPFEPEYRVPEEKKSALVLATPCTYCNQPAIGLNTAALPVCAGHAGGV